MPIRTIVNNIIDNSKLYISYSSFGWRLEEGYENRITKYQHRKYVKSFKIKERKLEKCNHEMLQESQSSFTKVVERLDTVNYFCKNSHTSDLSQDSKNTYLEKSFYYLKG